MASTLTSIYIRLGSFSGSSLYRENFEEPLSVVACEPCDPMVDGDPIAAEFVGDTAMLVRKRLSCRFKAKEFNHNMEHKSK